MSFTEPQASQLLSTAYASGRFPHALLVIGDEATGTHKLVLGMIRLINEGTKGDSLEAIRDEYMRLVRPRSKSRKILIDDVRSVEPFLQQKADANHHKIVVILEAERMNDEAANAFLKTLEEPPNQTLIILVTSQPEQLLPTIISRCINVPLFSPGGSIRLTPVQQELLPAWAEATEHMGDDLAALSFRSVLLELLGRRKADITKRMTQSLKEESKAIAQATDTSNWESQNKDLNAALIETEYLAERDQAIDLMILWFGQAAAIASGAPSTEPMHPGVIQLARTMPVPEILQRMKGVEQLRADLKFNVHEGLCMDVHLLEALGNLNV